jgi:hypothetical protein
MNRLPQMNRLPHTPRSPRAQSGGVLDPPALATQSEPKRDAEGEPSP